MGVILNSARTAARGGVLSTREVGQLISTALADGKLNRGEISDLKKVQTELQQELSPSARKALRNFLSLGSDFEPGLAGKIFGLGDEDADKLESAGVRTTQDLLLRNTNPADRAATANQAGLSDVMVTALVEQADLARTVGIGAKYAAMLNKVGINDVQELSSQNAVQLRRQVTSFLNTTEGQAITSRRPSLKTVKKWIKAAKALPRMVRQQGDSGADFNKAQFDALPADQRASFLFGADVRVAGGFVFDDRQTDVSLVRRRPAELAGTIDGLIDGGFDGEYETVETVSIERVKVGDELLGFRASFDVLGESEMDSEHAGLTGGSLRLIGTVDVVFDDAGKVIEAQHFTDWDFNHEG